MNIFMNPDTSPHFVPLVLDFFDRLYTGGHIVLRETDSPYCEGCARYLFEADVSGKCGHCGVGVTGNTCEECGRVNDCRDLVGPTCNGCKKPASTRPVKRLVFPLAPWAEKLARYHEKTVMSPHLRAFCEKYIADGLPEVAVSHPSTWGIPVPDVGVPELEGQKLYVWFEMAMRYFAYAQHINDKTGADGDWSRFWKSADAEVVMFFGFDNSFWYTCMVPALQLAYDGDVKPPTAFVTNEFYRLDGLKFSTSRGHSILGREMLAAAPRDMVRFYLGYSGPERAQTNFTIAEFEDTVQRELVGGWQPWLEALKAKVDAECDGAVPDTGDWTSEQLHFYRGLRRSIADAAEALTPATFSPQRLTRVLCELVREADRFGHAEEFWKSLESRSQERRTSIALELVAAKTLAFLSAPLMPGFAQRLWTDLGLEGEVAAGSWEDDPSWLPGGRKLGALGKDYFPGVHGCLPGRR